MVLKDFRACKKKQKTMTEFILYSPPRNGGLKLHGKKFARSAKMKFLEDEIFMPTVPKDFKRKPNKEYYQLGS